MSLNCYGRVFALTVASFAGASGCSADQPQEKAETANVESGTKTQLAVEEPPGRSEEGQALPPNVDEKKPVEELVEIPLSSILTTSPQVGMVQVREAFPQTSDDRKNVFTKGYLQRLLHEAKGGASNAFLVDATDASDAIDASFRVLVASGGAEIPVPINKPDPLLGNHWLVVYLGSGPSNPTWWTVESVIVDKARVVLSYRKPKPQPATDDIRRYYYWVPLGKLDFGAFEIQLFDADEGAVTLMRRVEVGRTTEREGRDEERQPQRGESDGEKPDGEVVEIPLDQIWAYKMPGTRDLRELPAARADERLIASIRRSLEPKLDHKQAERGFAVLGTGDEALRHAHDVLVSGDDATVRFPAGKELSAIFFTYQSPFYVHLATVERTGFAIKISYRFVPHESGETTEHVALIPLGELPPGRYRVSVKSAPMEKKYTDQGFPPIPDSAGLQLVSRPFHFIVAE